MSAGKSDDAGIVHGDVTNLIYVQNAHGGVNVSPPKPPSEPPSHTPVPHELPPEPDHFENQSAALASLDAPGPAGPRLHLLIGPPGSGKSATAIHWANQITDRFKDGRIYLDLRGHDPRQALEPHNALGSLLSSLGVDASAQPADIGRRMTAWRTHSRDLDLLILLDNAASSEQVSPLLCTGAETVTIVTSRDALVDLTFVDDVRVTPIDVFTPEHAVALLRRLIEPRRGPVDDRDLVALAERCGCLQLALRVAAQRLAKSPLLTVAELAEELRGPTQILEKVRAVFDSSYRSLRPATARLFRLLGVAPGSDVSHEAILALTGVSRAEVREKIGELLTSHLLADGRPGRYVMHDLLHAYAAELAATERYQGEADAALDRLGSWYTRAVLAAAHALGSEQPEPADAEGAVTFASGAAAQQWYNLEEPNLAIMVNALTSRGMNSTALDLCSAVVELYAFNTASSWIDVAHTGLRLAERAGDTTAEAWFRESLGKAHAQTGDLERALTEHEAALALRREAGDEAAQARSLNALGLVHWRTGALDRAETLFLDARELARRRGDRDFEAFALMNLGHVALNQASYERALAFLDAALALLDRDRQPFYCTNALYNRAEALLGLGRLDEAHTCALDAVDLSRQLANALVLAPALRVLALVKTALGDRVGAHADLTEAAGLYRDLGDQPHLAEIQTLLDGTSALPDRSP